MFRVPSKYTRSSSDLQATHERTAMHQQIDVWGDSLEPVAQQHTRMLSNQMIRAYINWQENVLVRMRDARHVLTRE
jgi:hypothetical protein